MSPPAYSSATQSCGAFCDRDLGQALVAADAVIGVDDEVAGAERRQLGQEGVGALPALAAADEPVAEHVLLGEQGDVGGGEAVVELDDGERDLALGGGAQRLLPAVHLGGLRQAVVGEQALQPLARAGRIAGQHDLLASPRRSVGDMVDHRLVDVGVLRPLRREVAGRRRPRNRCTVGAFRLVEGRGEVERPLGDQRAPIRRAAR